MQSREGGGGKDFLPGVASILAEPDMLSAPDSQNIVFGARFDRQVSGIELLGAEKKLEGFSRVVGAVKAAPALFTSQGIDAALASRGQLREQQALGGIVG